MNDPLATLFDQLLKERTYLKNVTPNSESSQRLGRFRQARVEVFGKGQKERLVPFSPELRKRLYRFEQLKAQKGIRSDFLYRTAPRFQQAHDSTRAPGYVGDSYHPIPLRKRISARKADSTLDSTLARKEQTHSAFKKEVKDYGRPTTVALRYRFQRPRLNAAGAGELWVF